MLQLLYPYEYVKSVFAIDYKKLYDKGYRGIIYDIDNTLVHHGDDSNPRVDRLFRHLHKLGFKTLLLSNNEESRVERFIKNIDTLYVCDAEKPKKHGYEEAIEKLSLDKKEIVYIGDQVFTDIFGANRCGLASILVRFIRLKDEVKIGKRRELENVVLSFYKKSRKYQHRIGDIRILKEGQVKEETKPAKVHKNFCDINPLCYAISENKEILKRHLKNMSKKDFTHTRSHKKLPVVVYAHSNGLIKRGKGIDPVLQENKAVNIDLACKQINGTIIRPGEEFSFWKTVGKTTKRKGYKDGRVIIHKQLQPGIGGGLCNLSNTINLLILHSPLTITELHFHSDALAPDHGGRVPFSAGTSVSYNYIDYRFKNNTDQVYQLLTWCADEKLFAELRCQKDIPYAYEITEEDHHFHKEGENYFRISKIYKDVYNKSTHELIEKELIRDNHSMVMFSHDQIPEDQIR